MGVDYDMCPLYFQKPLWDHGVGYLGGAPGRPQVEWYIIRVNCLTLSLSDIN